MFSEWKERNRQLGQSAWSTLCTKSTFDPKSPNIHNHWMSSKHVQSKNRKHMHNNTQSFFFKAHLKTPYDKKIKHLATQNRTWIKNMHIKNNKYIWAKNANPRGPTWIQKQNVLHMTIPNPHKQFTNPLGNFQMPVGCINASWVSKHSFENSKNAYDD